MFKSTSPKEKLKLRFVSFKANLSGFTVLFVIYFLCYPSHFISEKQWFYIYIYCFFFFRANNVVMTDTYWNYQFRYRYVFLFAKGILICKTLKSQFTHKLSIEFSHNQEIVDMPHWTLPREEQNSKHSYLWAIKYRKGNTDQQYIFAAKTMPMKRQWESVMKKQLSEFRDEKANPPEAPARVPTLKGTCVISSLCAQAPFFSSSWRQKNNEK